MEAEKVKDLVKDFSKNVEIVGDRRINAVVEKETYRDLVQEIRDNGVYHISTITATDMGEGFELIYHFDCGDGVVLNMRFGLPKEDGRVATITDIFPGAEFYEREIIDMFGIEVEDHPDPRRLYMADNWPEGKYPLRKGMFDYKKLSEKDVSEIKDIAKDDEEFDPELMLQAEKENKDREPLKEWLENQISESEEEEGEKE